MKAPTKGQWLYDREGRPYLVEEVSEPDEDGFFLVELVAAADANDMGGMGYELDPEEFAAFCAEHGITLPD